MKSFLYLISYCLLRIIALLPLGFLYFISDLLWPLTFYIIRYRKSTVYTNLKNSFPEWTEEEIHICAKKFYRHFTDIIMETIKTLDYSPARIRKRMSLRNPELMNELYANKKSILLVASHYGNWEWIMGLAEITSYRTLAVYKPLHNKRADQIMKKIRTKASTELIPMRWILKSLSTYKKENILSLSLFVADQSPVKEEAEYWTTFLNQDTAVYIGIEKIAKKFDLAVLFCKIKKRKRGYYEATLVPIAINPNETAPYEITNQHLQLLESMIREEPSEWLWSHRRWKLNRQELLNNTKFEKK